MSSSGLVPMPFSKRVLKEYWVSLSTPLSLEMLPLPSFSPPRQIADAFRFIVSLFCPAWIRGDEPEPSHDTKPPQACRLAYASVQRSQPCADDAQGRKLFL